MSFGSRATTLSNIVDKLPQQSQTKMLVSQSGVLEITSWHTKEITHINVLELRAIFYGVLGIVLRQKSKGLATHILGCSNVKIDS